MSKIKSRRLSVLEVQASRLEKEIAKCSMFADGIKTDFWKGIEEKYKAKLEVVELRLDTYQSLSNEQVREVLANRLSYREFLGIKDYAKARTDFQNKLVVIQQRIRDEKERE
jgi:hypothetical protein